MATPSIEERRYVDSGLRANTRYAYRIVLNRADGAVFTDDLSVATHAYKPMLSRQMGSTGTRLQLPLVDERNPDYTEYQVTLRGGADWNEFVSDWSSSKCRTFNDLEPGAGYLVTTIARSLDGQQTSSSSEYAELVGGGEQGPPVWVFTWAQSGSNDPWVQARIRDAAAAYGLTDAAVDWISNDIHVTWQRGEPRRFSYSRGQVQMGHSRLGPFMRDAMLGFWNSWDGFPNPCGEMNVYTFRRDVAQFALEFRGLEASGAENHLAPWRAYYNLIVGLRHLDGLETEDFWDALEKGEYGRFGAFWHRLEASIPGYNPHHPSLIPPTLRKYFVGFMEDGEERTWEEELDWFSRLADNDLALWLPFFTKEVLQYSPRTQDLVSRTRIPEPLRTSLRTADRQLLVDFINTLEDQKPWGWWVDSQGAWNHHVRFHLYRVPLYRAELGSSTGIELEPSNLAAVSEALQLLYDFRCDPRIIDCWHYGRRDGNTRDEQVRQEIRSIQPLSQAQREILLAMVDLGT